MKNPINIICLILIFTILGASSNKNLLDNSELFSLDGKTFHGQVRAKGILSIFKGRNILKFNNGFLTWSDGSSIETGEYQIIKKDNMIQFTAQTPLKYDGGIVLWEGFYNGKILIDVQANWVRGEKGHFLHDLLLPDIVTWKFISD